MFKRILTGLLDRLAPGEGLLLMVLAVLVGSGTGLAAVFFICLIAFIHNFAYAGAGDVREWEGDMPCMEQRTRGFNVSLGRRYVAVSACHIQ